MARGRPRKKDTVLLKSAEFIGWALGGLEREIAETRQRLAALNEQAGRLRARLGAGVRTGLAGSPSLDGAARGRKRKHRKISAAERKRISERMTK